MPSDPQRRTSDKEPAIRRTVRENLRNRRIELGLSQKQLGERIGVTQQWIQQLEAPNNDNLPSLYQLEEFALHLGATAAELLTPRHFRS
jgi:transcriptional regulator with XRE-family HTH domain